MYGFQVVRIITPNDGGFAFVPLTDNSNFSTKLQSGITPNPVLALGFKNFREALKNEILNGKQKTVQLL